MYATDGRWLGGDQMHRAVADLFLDDNPAPLDSARDAGYGQDALPSNVVLVGHSLGGGLVIDVARMMAADEAGSNPPSSYKLAGVVMLEASHSPTGADLGGHPRPRPARRSGWFSRPRDPSTPWPVS